MVEYKSTVLICVHFFNANIRCVYESYITESSKYHNDNTIWLRVIYLHGLESDRCLAWPPFLFLFFFRADCSCTHFHLEVNIAGRIKNVIFKNTVVVIVKRL